MEPRGGIACRNLPFDVAANDERLREGGERLFVRLDRGAVARRYGEVVLLFDGLFGLGLSGLRIFLARVSGMRSAERMRTSSNVL